MKEQISIDDNDIPVDDACDRGVSAQDEHSAIDGRITREMYDAIGYDEREGSRQNFLQDVTRPARPARSQHHALRLLRGDGVASKSEHGSDDAPARA
jgi:hypothetical protein